MSTGTRLRSATPPTMPHMALLPSPLALGLHGPLPVVDRDLARARQREFVGRRVGGDGRACADGCAVADLDGRDHHAARADEGAAADLGTPFVDAVVIAGDRAGADVDATANLAVADVAQVIHLAALADEAVLHFDEIPQMHAIGQPRLRPQARERPDLAAGPDLGVLNHAVGV